MRIVPRALLQCAHPGRMNQCGQPGFEAGRQEDGLQLSCKHSIHMQFETLTSNRIAMSCCR